MKYFLLLAFVITSFAASSQTAGTLDSTKKVTTVEASCGKCKFGLAGKTCDLAVRIHGKSYYVDGVSIDDFGDAHADNGFCKTIRKAEVQGEVVNGKFKATYFALLPSKKKK
jgi:hypothetical protein